VLTATVIDHGGSVTVHLGPLVGDDEEGEEGTEAGEIEEGPSPIVPELKELAWTSGAFVVFALVMRYLLYPKLRKGMDARHQSIRDDHAGADAARAAARAEVSDYEREVAVVKAEAAARVDAARQTLEGERRTQLAASNAKLAEARAAAAEQDEAARVAVRDQVQAAVADVVGRAVELATGRRPSAEMVDRSVTDAMSTGAGVGR